VLPFKKFKLPLMIYQGGISISRHMQITIRPTFLANASEVTSKKVTKDKLLASIAEHFLFFVK